MYSNRALRLISEPRAEPIDLAEAKAQLNLVTSSDDLRLSAIIRAARQRVEEITRRVLVLQQWRMSLDQFPLMPYRFPRQDMMELPFPPLQSVDGVTYIAAGDGIQYTWDPSLYQVDLESEPARLMPAYAQIWPSVRYVPNAVQVTFCAGYLTPFAATASSTVLAAPGHRLVNGQALRLSNSGGALPAGLALDTDYYVVNAAANSFGLSATSGGSAIAPTGAGTGLSFAGRMDEQLRQAMLLLIGAWYENREAIVTDSRVNSLEIPMGVRYLLAGKVVSSF